MEYFPTLPIHTEKYLADTRHLTTAQHGATFIMMMTAWRHEDNSLPNDDDFLARITGMGKKTWLKNKMVILELWNLKENNRWSQNNLDAVKNYVNIKRSQKSTAGVASALKKKETGSTDVEIPPQQNTTSVATDGQQYNTNTYKEERGGITVRETREEISPPLKQKNDFIKTDPPPPKISGALIVNLLKRQERGEKLSDADQQIVNNHLKSNGIQEPKKPPEDPYAVVKSLIWQRDKLGRGHLFTASQISEIAKYESLHNNNHLNGARVG